MKTARTLLALLLAVATTACGERATAQRDRPGDVTLRFEPVTVHAVNYNRSAVGVWATLDGRTRRLGEVESGGTALWMLPDPAHGADEVDLTLEPVGSDDVYRIGPALVSSGETIEVTVESRIELSTVTVVKGT